MKKLITSLFFSMLVFSQSVMALPATNEVTQVCWAAPTEDAGGTPIGARAITFYMYFWDKATGAPIDTQRVIANGVTCLPLSSVTLSDTTVEIGITAFFNDSPTSKESLFSNIIEVTNAAGVWTSIDGNGVPNSPTILQAQ